LFSELDVFVTSNIVPFLIQQMSVINITPYRHVGYVLLYTKSRTFLMLNVFRLLKSSPLFKICGKSFNLKTVNKKQTYNFCVCVCVCVHYERWLSNPGKPCLSM